MKKIIFFIVLVLAMLVPLVAYASEPYTVRVGLVRSFENRDSISLTNIHVFVGYGMQEGFMAVQEFTSSTGFVVRQDSGQVVLVADGQIVYRFTSGTRAQILPAGGNFLNMVASTGTAYSYRGVMEFVPQTGGSVTAVNVISVEEYLYGVLPSEMSPSFQIEALKAQAVAARTFTFYQINEGRHTASGFDLCDTTHCQVYRGAGLEHTNTNRAVDETFGLVMFHSGRPILASYFSSSGGATDNSENVWFEARPYLRSVNEIIEHNPMVWERQFTWAQLTQAANSAGFNIGTVNAISVSHINESGRAAEITLFGTNGQRIISREANIRNFFSSIGGALPSSNFTITGALPTTQPVTVTNGTQNFNAPLNNLQVLNTSGAVSTAHMAYVFDGTNTRRINSTPTTASGGSGITIAGRGWGHGVGMSQLGAEGMARIGFSFWEILQHYYTGVEIRNAY